jgi:hypothetical protein
MRSVHTDGSVHAQRARTSPTGLAFGTGVGVASLSLFLIHPLSCATFAPSPLRGLHRYYGRSHSCAPRLFGTWSMNTAAVSTQFSLIHVHVLPDHSVSKHLGTPVTALSRYPSAQLAFLALRSGLRHSHAGSSMSPCRIQFVSYGLVVHLLLLSTTHRCVAVAFGYRPESVCLERTFTSLNVRAFRRA